MKLSEKIERVARATGIATNHAYTETLREAAELARRVEVAEKIRVVSDDIGTHIDLATWHAAGLAPGEYAAVPVEVGA